MASSDAHAQARARIFAGEPDGTWHPLCEAFHRLKNNESTNTLSASAVLDPTTAENNPLLTTTVCDSRPEAGHFCTPPEAASKSANSTVTEALVASGARIETEGNVIVRADSQFDATPISGAGALGDEGAAIGLSANLVLAEQTTEALVDDDTVIVARGNAGETSVDLRPDERTTQLETAAALAGLDPAIVGLVFPKALDPVARSVRARRRERFAESIWEASGVPAPCASTRRVFWNVRFARIASPSASPPVPLRMDRR